MNKLLYGDCLTLMQAMDKESIDLIYLDPPFNSNQNYNAIYKDETGRPLPTQIEAFCDTWELDIYAVNYIETLNSNLAPYGISDEAASALRGLMQGLKRFDKKLAAYLAYMTERLVVMRDLLKPTGSIYLHCDPTASHYLKIVMDVIFGTQNFRNEIIWRIGWVSGYKTQKKGWIRNHDVILYYVKSKDATKKFNKEYIPYPEDYVRRDGKPPTGKGIPIEDTWNCQPADTLNSIMIQSFSREKMGYPTQKPLALLDRIIKASSNEGDVILDPFCGCATTIESAHNLGRKWIGIDIAVHAIMRVSKRRLEDKLSLIEKDDFTIEGVPQDMEGARHLAKHDPYQFQKWVVEEVEGFVSSKQTADGGVDGRLYFTGESLSKSVSSMIIEVKGGENVGSPVARTLRGVLEREQVEMAGLILLKAPTGQQAKNFKAEMAEAGSINIDGKNYARMQLLSVEDILTGKKFNVPGRVVADTTAEPSLPASLLGSMKKGES